MDGTNLLPTSEAARRIGISRQRVHKLIENGQIKAVRLGRYYYVEDSEVERYLALPDGKPYARRSTDDDYSIDNCQ